jgi:hypothetical protein
VSDASGATTGLGTDFTVQSNNNGAISLSSANNGATFTFVAVPDSVTSSFFVTVRNGGNVVSGGQKQYTVYGIPDDTSTLVCNDARVRAVSDSVTCTITVKSGEVPTTGVSSDFSFVPDVFGATPTLGTTNGGSTFTFTLAPFTTFIDSYSISANVGASSISRTFRVYAPFKGTPSSDHSSIACTPELPRAGSQLSCMVVFTAAFGIPTAVVSQDVAVISFVSGGTGRRSVVAASINTKDGGHTYTFDVDLPSMSTQGYLVAVSVASQPIVASTVTVYGTPTAQSLMSCHVRDAADDARGVVRVLSPVDCTIAASDNSGTIIASASDFVVEVNNDAVDTSELSTSDAGKTFSLTLLSPNTSVPYFTIAASLSSGGARLKQGLSVYTLLCKSLTVSHAIELI